MEDKNFLSTIAKQWDYEMNLCAKFLKFLFSLDESSLF